MGVGKKGARACQVRRLSEHILSALNGKGLETKFDFFLDPIRPSRLCQKTRFAAKSSGFLATVVL